MVCWLDRTTKEIKCLGKYVDILDPSHLETAEDTESHRPSSSKQSPDKCNQEIAFVLYAIDFSSFPFWFLSVFHEKEN